MQRSDPKSSVWPGLAGAVVAVVLNLWIYVSARAADVSFVVPGFEAGAGPMEISAINVAFVTLFAFLIGTGVAALAHLRGRLRLVLWLGLAVALVSLGAPLTLDAATSTKLSLASMHVVAGAVFFVALHRIAARERERRDASRGAASPVAP